MDATLLQAIRRLDSLGRDASTSLSWEQVRARAGSGSFLRRTLRAALWASVLGVTLTGCGADAVTVPLDALCVHSEAFSAAGDFVLRAGDRVHLSRASSVCRTSCDAVVAAGCTLTRSGDTFRLGGEVRVEVDCRGSDPPPVCVFHEATCVTEPLPEGEYTVTDGVRSRSFRVPSEISTRARCTR